MGEAFAPTTMGELLGLQSAGARVLDVGCGKGSFRYADYPHLAIAALDEFPLPTGQVFPTWVEYTEGSVENLPYRADAFDLVIANFMLEHVADFPRAIDEIARVLKPQGHLYMAVPNARSFEDALYRAIYVGGGHLQRHTLSSVIETVYGRTALKLLAYNEWPAGFTFLEDREALRSLVGQFTAALHESSQIDLRAESNYLFVFQRQEGLGRRTTPAACGYCGAGSPAGIKPYTEWDCAACGRRNGVRTPGRASDAELDADMRALWERHPHLRPATGIAQSQRLAPLVQAGRRAKQIGRRLVGRVRKGIRQTAR